MKPFKHPILPGFLFVGLLLATLSSCKTCNCPAYSQEQAPVDKPATGHTSPTG